MNRLLINNMYASRIVCAIPNFDGFIIKCQHLFIYYSK